MTEHYPDWPDTPPPYVVLRDGKFSGGSRFANENEVFADLLHRQGQSVSYALTHGGYSVISVPEDRWSDKEAEFYERMATQRMYGDAAHNAGHHERDAEMLDLTRTNCAACALRGYYSGDEHDVERDGPVYAAWPRIYVESHTPIPAKWRDAFERERHDDNTSYVAALERSITTFGVRFI